MSYSFSLFFRSPEFPYNDWLEILSWFGAWEQPVDLATLEYAPNLKKNWFIPVGEYGVFCQLEERYPKFDFWDNKAFWNISIDCGSGFGLRQFFGFTLCYCVLSLIPETSAWDCDEYFDNPYSDPQEFLRKANTLIDSHHLYKRHKARLKMQQLGVMDEGFQLIPDPHALKLAAQSNLYDH